MLLCGLKITHDASVALVDGNRLIRCVEVEKLENNSRYSEMGTVSRISSILRSEGVSADDVDRYVIDGWHDVSPGAEPVGEVSTGGDTGERIRLTVGSYNEVSSRSEVLKPVVVQGGLRLNGRTYDYVSYKHVAGHIFAAYCTSPFAASKSPAYVLVWDGGQYPRLYLVDPTKDLITSLGPLFGFQGTIYGIMGHYFGPYKRTPEQLEQERREQATKGYFGGHSIAGKLMSYIGLGQVDADLVDQMHRIYRRDFQPSHGFEHAFMEAVTAVTANSDYSDADILLCLHTFIEELLTRSLRKKLDTATSQNVCFSGGAALNIKWNSAIRRSIPMGQLWVPPFPNDSGNGIGAACCEMVIRTGDYALDWSVYSGPAITAGAMLPGWSSRSCTLSEIAHLLAFSNQPIVFLNGPAELGPRALGNRSILASAATEQMKLWLNDVKRREHFRPVAPICLEEDAPLVFDPGTPDPFMLFDHRIRDSWVEKVPAIRHLDGTARLQTVSHSQNPVVYNILTAYRNLTGIPLLCNTSANLNGSGFFPDAESAMRWGGVDLVYCDGVLYERHGLQ